MKIYTEDEAKSLVRKYAEDFYRDGYYEGMIPMDAAEYLGQLDSNQIFNLMSKAYKGKIDIFTTTPELVLVKDTTQFISTEDYYGMAFGDLTVSYGNGLYYLDGTFEIYLDVHCRDFDSYGKEED